MKKLFILMLSIFTVAAASAQVTTSGMNGTVTDEQGQPLAGATLSPCTPLRVRSTAP